MLCNQVLLAPKPFVSGDGGELQLSGNLVSVKSSIPFEAPDGAGGEAGNGSPGVAKAGPAGEAAGSALEDDPGHAGEKGKQGVSAIFE